MNSNFVRFKNAVINTNFVRSIKIYDVTPKAIIITYHDGSYNYAYTDENEEYYDLLIKNFPNLNDYLSNAFYITLKRK